jgi:ATP-dependent helicase HrpA/adenine-specific DNA-methyltransferase
MSTTSARTLMQAKNLRQTMTEAERKLWSCLRNRQFHNLKFRRQTPLPPYVADFLCESAKIIIEVDGGQHTPDKDRVRTERLQRSGVLVLRYWNNDVLKNIAGVLEDMAVQIFPDCNPSS